MDEPKVNDGKGLYDYEGLLDTIIVQCNSTVQCLLAGQMVAFCDNIAQIAKKASVLKKGIAQDMESKDEVIEDLRRHNDDLARRLFEATGKEKEE